MNIINPNTSVEETNRRVSGMVAVVKEQFKKDKYGNWISEITYPDGSKVTVIERIKVRGNKCYVTYKIVRQSDKHFFRASFIETESDSAENTLILFKDSEFESKIWYGDGDMGGIEAKHPSLSDAENSLSKKLVHIGEQVLDVIANVADFCYYNEEVWFNPQSVN